MANAQSELTKRPNITTIALMKMEFPRNVNTGVRSKALLYCSKETSPTGRKARHERKSSNIWYLSLKLDMIMKISGNANTPVMPIEKKY